ncbi:SAF domain-containing protein [Viridibacillus arvi]|uniref:SAF domain-containing protein n=1 Tax=Viridibacillus arvi TaxID=263475 RepID=UPI0034CEE179
MGIRLRTKKLIKAGLVGAGIMLAISSVGSYIIYSNVQDDAFRLKQEYKQEIAELQKVADNNVSVYSIVRDVKKGEKITESMIEEVFVPAGAVPKDIALKPVLDAADYFAKTDLKENQVLSEAMLYKEEAIDNDVREAEYAFIELPTKLKNEEYVDIRIQFPSGEDYVLLSKKKVKDFLGLTVWLNIDEGEILTMSSAIVDAYVEGAKIYAMKYVDEHMQVKSQMTYPVKKNVLELIKESPNVVDIAQLNLEQQNRERLEKSLVDIGDDIKQQVKSGNSSTKSAVTEDSQKRSAEERLESINQEAAQQQIISGSESEGDE